MKRLILLTLSSVLLAGAVSAQVYTPNLPLVDISGETTRHTIIAAGTPTQYNGHPTTVTMNDGKTIFCAWSHNHGGKLGFIAKSVDGGQRWEHLEVPKDWSETSNCPSVYSLTDKKGKERLFVFAGAPKMSYCYSEDMGVTWSPMKSLNKPCVMAFADIKRLSNGDYLGVYHRGYNDYDRPPLTLWASVSKDGGLTWGESYKVGEMDGRAPCEPFIVESPDKKELAIVARENLKVGNSLVSYSTDEGKTWSAFTETPWGLTGDRHIIRYLPDGRLVAAFRDQAKGSPTRGHFVAWVGTYMDLKRGYSGQYRIKLLHSYAWHDCGYPGVEILSDGTVLATTYIKYAPGENQHSVVAVRFKPEETDKMVPTASK